MSKIFVSLLILLVIPLSLAYEVRCSEDNKYMELVYDQGDVAERFRKCECITMADRAFCVQDENFKPFCYDGASISAEKQGNQFFELGKQCENGCNEETGGCYGCCEKNGFSKLFGNNCYESDHIQKCGFLARFNEKRCFEIDDCGMEDDAPEEGSCFGCDSELLKQNSLCGIYFNQISKEVYEEDLDEYFFIALALRESSCRYYIHQGAFQVLGLSGPKFIPVENKRCEQEMLTGEVTAYCDEFQAKINYQTRVGVNHFYDDWNRIQETNMTKKIALGLFTYNRGYPATEYVEDYLEEGYSLYDALVKGCKEIYNGRIQSAVDSNGNDMCTYWKGYGACYPSAFIENLKTIATYSGGYINPELLELSRDTITQCLPS